MRDYLKHFLLCMAALACLIAASYLAYAADTGFEFAGTGTSDGGAGGAWTNPDRIVADDGSYAEFAGTGAGGVENLQATNFGFSIPDGATIDGIEVTIQGQDEGTAGLNVVQLMKDGSTPIGTDLETGVTDWTLSDTIYTYGGATEMWGTTWTEAEVEAAGFGATFDFSAASAFGTFVDYVAVKVYYTEAAPSETAATASVRTSQVQVRSGTVEFR